MQETRRKIATILMDKMGVEQEELTDNANLSCDLGMDSLDTVEVLMEVEREFNISIEDEEAEKIETFGQLVQLVNDRVSNVTRQNKWA